MRNCNYFDLKMMLIASCLPHDMFSIEISWLATFDMLPERQGAFDFVPFQIKIRHIEYRMHVIIHMISGAYNNEFMLL